MDTMWMNRTLAGTGDRSCAVEIQRLTFGYPGSPLIFDSADFTLERGTINVLLGPNGAGKTTLLDLLCGLVPMRSGRVSFFGQTSLVAGFGPGDVARVEPRVRRCFQIPVIVEELSVRDNVMLGANGGKDGEIAKTFWFGRHREVAEDVSTGADCVLEQVGLSAKAEVSAGSLSFGERKMLDLCRALNCDAKLLLLDEPFANLHAGLAERLAQLLVHLRTQGTTLFLIEHSPERYLEFVDSALEIRDRKLVEADPGGYGLQLFGRPG